MKASQFLVAVFVMVSFVCSGQIKGAHSLKEALKGKFYIGAALNANQITGKDTQGIKLLREQFNAIVAENCMKSQELHPEENRYNFALSDQFVALGEREGMFIIGHTLIWHSQLPTWFCIDENGNNVAPEVLKARMKDHITTVVSRYKGRVKGWDVVNEAILEDGSYRKSKFYEILGEEFIPLAFQYAHEADPDAELYYNDYNEWYTGKREAVVKLVKTLKARGIRIDGIGMQGHIDMENPSLEKYEEAILAYYNAGVKVMITELDLSILPFPKQGIGADISADFDYRKELNPYMDGLPEHVSEVWNKRMSDFFNLFIKHSDKISRVTMWGLADGDSWKNNFPVRGRTDYPLLFDRNHKPKEVVRMIIDESVADAGMEENKRASKDGPVFSQFIYKGKDPVYTNNPLQQDEFYNPILQGCYPDPSITRKGNDYYLVSSSFAFFPGVPVFHSNDLVNWKQIGHVLDRPSQLKVETAGMAMGVYAPDIMYNPYNDTFYMITTQFAGGMGNMVVKTKDPSLGWSDPIKLQFAGIDPALFFDDDGKAYVVHNDAPDKGKELYQGHRVIKIWEYDTENDKVIVGTDKIIVDGGVDISQKPIWIEAPHIYKKDGRYYLMCAEGGTGGWHSEVVFVSDDPKGPYIPAPDNPILSQRHLPGNRKNKVDWAGHADLVQTPDGKYYGVFLAVRPNEKDRVNTGRETFILPVDWSGDFPVFVDGLLPLNSKLKLPEGIKNQTGKNGFFPNGNFTFIDELTSEKPDYRWIGLREQRENFIHVTLKGTKIIPYPTNIKEVKPTSTLFHRQQHNHFEFTVTMDYQPDSEKDLAGIVCYQNETYHYVFGVTRKGNDCYLVLERTEDGKSVVVASEKIDVHKPVRLQVEAQGDNYRFNYASGQRKFKNLGGVLSGDILSTDVAGGFTGCLIGLHATTANDIKP